MSPERPDTPLEQEPGDLQPRAVLLGVAGVIAMILIVALVASTLARVEEHGDSRPPHSARRLSSDPVEDIAAFEREKRSQLNSYGWVNREHSAARIPIGRAMHILAARGRASATGQRQSAVAAQDRPAAATRGQGSAAATPSAPEAR
jgi:hypothetical protein